MPRKTRKQSNSGIYHVMLRGINHQQIFEDEQDNMIFINTVKKCKEICGYKILAYCLMGNHVHLLIREGEMGLGQIFKHIGTRYVYWYNTKYQRTGHLFQGRFKSEPVEDLAYLITVIRYIHQNPVKAGICKNPAEYRYSSFNEYLGKVNLVDFDCVEKFVSVGDIINADACISTDNCMDVETARIRSITDQKAKEIIRRITGAENVTSFQSLSKADQRGCIIELKKNNASIRQISRLTGVSCYLINKNLGIRRA